jgi:hypothetical protein
MKTDCRLAIGPVARFPSWQWVGEDTGKELAKYFQVSFFETGQIPDADVALVIKHLPTLQFVNRIKTIYCPIDFFSFEASIGQQAKILEKCALVLSHSYRLVPLLAKYCATKPIDHHLKFKTKEIPDYKKEGFVLWAGGFESSPYFLQWLDAHPLPHPVRLLTNYKDKNAVMAGVALADKLKTKARQESSSEMTLELWSAKRQVEIMSEAKAAIDIKGNNFQQLHKPATKAQKYLCSGVPVAVNRESESYEYLAMKGLRPAVPEDLDYWFSEDYYMATNTLATVLREELSLKSIGERYRDIILGICNSHS